MEKKEKTVQNGISGFRSIPAEGNPDFDWNEMEDSSDRIRSNSRKYRDLTVVEAFSKAYGVQIGRAAKTAEDLPVDAKIGQKIRVGVLSVSKGNTVFDSGNMKDPVSSTVDLYKFPTFKQFVPKEPIEVTVVDKRNGTLYVDPIRPLVDRWEESIQDPSKQFTYTTDESVEVKNLRWVHGGFIGQLDVPQVSQFTGQPFLVDAFIPGSQIVLNIERDFDRWIGRSVRAFVTNPPAKTTNGRGSKSVVCSVKKYLENKGNVFKINLFKSWTEDGELWKANEKVTYDGVVTGVIHSSKKCGVFVELPSANITGLVAEDPEKLSEYHPGDHVSIKITSFDEIKRYDPMVDQMKCVIPYRIENGVITECNLKPVFEFVK